MLTRKQAELLRFIHERLKEAGVPPSFDEMKEALDLASKSGIHRLITALEERGFIRRLPHRARALEVLKLPDSSTPSRGRGGFKPAIVPHAAPAPRGREAQAPVMAGDIPILGKIAAGVPIEAIQTEIGRVTAHAGYVPTDQLYGLIELLLLPARDENVGAFFNEPLGARQRQAARSTRDDCNLTLKLSHNYSLR